jgi:hypothetical protein
MNVTKIFYFSLLSVPWISAVRPALHYRDHQRQLIMEWFENLTDTEPDWKIAYDRALGLGETMPDVLDSYFRNAVYHLGKNVNSYLYYMYTPGFHPEHFPSEHHPYAGLPKLVYMIRYYNIRILHNVKLSWEPGVYHALLAVINNQYVRNLSTLYHEMKREEVPFESYMMEAAILYSMNKAMLVTHPDSQQGKRLIFYKNITEWLHRHLAQFMEPTTRHQCIHNVQDYEFRINELARFKIHGYENPDIQAIVLKMAHQILYVIAISGSDSASGLEKLAGHLNNHQSVRRILHVDEPGYSTDGMFWQKLVLILKNALLRIPMVFLDRHEWYKRLLPMVNKIIWLANQQPLNRSNHPVQLGT